MSNRITIDLNLLLANADGSTDRVRTQGVFLACPTRNDRIILTINGRRYDGEVNQVQHHAIIRGGGPHSDARTLESSIQLNCTLREEVSDAGR